MKVNYYYPTGQQLAFAARRLADMAALDPADLTFKAAPATTPPVLPMPEEAAPFSGSYVVDLGPAFARSAPADGAYEVTVRLAATPTVAFDGFTVYVKAGQGYTAAAVFNQVLPAVATAIDAALEDVAIFVKVGRVGGQQS